MSQVLINIGDPKSFSTAVTLAKIFEAVVREREHQTNKYGPVLETIGFRLGMKQGPGGHELGAWLLVVEKELNEAKEAATGRGLREKTGRHSVRSEILQIMATCCAALEQHGLEEGESMQKLPPVGPIEEHLG